MRNQYYILKTLALMLGVSALALGQNGRDLYERGVIAERTLGVQAAMPLFEDALRATPENPSNRALRARILVQIGSAYLRLGQDKGRDFLQQVVLNYRDQKDALRDAETLLQDAPSGPLTNPAIFIADMDSGGWAVQGTRARRLTTDASVADNWPQWSPDGKSIAFRRTTVSGTRTRHNIVVRSLSGAEETIPEQQDGTRYFLFRYPCSGGAYNTVFRSMLWLRSGELLLTDMPQGNAPDSSARIVSTRGVPFVLRKVEVQISPYAFMFWLTNNTGLCYANERPRIQGQGWSSFPYSQWESCALAPDDRTLYCPDTGDLADLLRLPRGKDRIAVLDTATGQVRVIELPPAIASGDGALASLQFSPKGTDLVFRRGDELVRAGISGEGLADYQILATGIGLVRHPRWTRDGTGILFSRSTDNVKWQILRIPERGGAIVSTGLEVTRPGGVVIGLSPDGSKIAFGANDHTIVPDSPFIPPPPAVSGAAPGPKADLEGLWALRGSEAARGSGLALRFYQTPTRGLGNSQSPRLGVRSIDIEIDARGMPGIVVSSAPFEDREGPAYTHDVLWGTLRDGFSPPRSTVTVTTAVAPKDELWVVGDRRVDLSSVSFSRRTDGRATSSSEVTVSSDGLVLTETRSELEAPGGPVTKVLVFDRVMPGGAAPEIQLSASANSGNSANAFSGAWRLNLSGSVPTPTDIALDLRRFEDLGQGVTGYFRVIIASNAAPVLSFGLLQSGSARDPAQALRLSRETETLATLFRWVEAGELAGVAVSRRVLDSANIEILGSPPPPNEAVYSRAMVSTDRMTLTEIRKTLNAKGEETGETILVYDRIAP